MVLINLPLLLLQIGQPLPLKWLSGDKTNLQLSRVSLQSHSYYRDITIDAHNIRIGCQTIRRHELEQIAVRLGFKGEKFENIPNLK